MRVMALAGALAGSSQADGTISLHDLQILLHRTGLDEFARAASSLARRGKRTELDPPDPPDDPPDHPWF